MRRPVLIALLCVAGAVAAAAAYGALTDQGGRESSYRTAKVERGAIVKSVTAAGKLNAVVTVKVGSQISGRVSELFADFNAEVTQNQVIARIDPTTFEARVNEAQADLEVARAQVVSKQAAVEQARANLANARALSTVLAAAAPLARSSASRLKSRSRSAAAIWALARSASAET